MSKRTLPLWMVRPAKPTASPNGVANEIKSETKLSDMSPSLEIEGEVPQRDQIQQKRRLRSNYTLPLVENTPDLKIEYLPFVEYNGVIEYYNSFHDIAFSCDQLLQWVQNQQPDSPKLPIAFDLEWPFNFKTGPGRTALMQLCATSDRCLLLQLSCLKRLPMALLELLYHPRVVLHGVNIKNDFRKLARDFVGVDADRLITQCVDLGRWYNELNGSTAPWSMERLVHRVLGMRINKDKRVRMSKWDVLPLSDDQKMYAAIDVYISQELYLTFYKKKLAQEKTFARCAQEAVETPLATCCSESAENIANNAINQNNKGSVQPVGGLLEHEQ